MAACPRCGNQMNYIGQYRQWFCYHCQGDQLPAYQPPIAQQRPYPLPTQRPPPYQKPPPSQQPTKQYPPYQQSAQSPSYQQPTQRPPPFQQPVQSPPPQQPTQTPPYQQPTQQYLQYQQPVQSPPYQQPTYYRPPAPQTQSRKGKNIVPIIAVVVIIAIVIAGILIFLLLTTVSDEERIIGSWRNYDAYSDIEQTITFRRNGTGEWVVSMDMTEVTMDFTWSLDEEDKELTLDMGYGPDTLNYSFIGDDKLRLWQDYGEEITYTRV